MKAKSLLTAALVALAASALVTGCETDETTILAAANTAGNLGLSAWFAIDAPDAEVKTALKDVVTLVNDGASRVGAGETYVDALAPVVQDVVARHDKLTPAQKNLINTGAAVILSALDTFVDANPRVKENAELASKVVAAFCRGCLTAIDRSEGCLSSLAIKRAHRVIRMQYDPAAKAFVAK